MDQNDVEVAVHLGPPAPGQRRVGIKRQVGPEVMTDPGHEIESRSQAPINKRSTWGTGHQEGLGKGRARARGCVGGMGGRGEDDADQGCHGPCAGHGRNQASVKGVHHAEVEGESGHVGRVGHGVVPATVAVEADTLAVPKVTRHRGTVNRGKQQGGWGGRATQDKETRREEARMFWVHEHM